jgi:hypothetical protein
MPGLDSLIASAGTWRGTNTLHDPKTKSPDESSGTLQVRPVLAERFVRLEYTWSYDGKPQEGSLLVGFDPLTKTISGHWIDTWHMGHQAMICLGTEPDGATFTLRGSYAPPTGPDWGWRIEITAAPNVDSLRITMHNIWPDGEREDPAVEAVYARFSS